MMALYFFGNYIFLAVSFEICTLIVSLLSFSVFLVRLWFDGSTTGYNSVLNKGYCAYA